MKASKFLRPKQTRYLACFATHKHMQLNTEVPEFNLAEIFSITHFIFLDSFTEILINLPRFSYFAHLAGLLPFLMCVIFLREELFFPRPARSTAKDSAVIHRHGYLPSLK